MELSKIIILGFMGAGKSTMGVLLSNEMDLPFVDLDHYIEEKEGDSIANIFKVHGESHFRRIEQDCLEELLSKSEKSVIALGGGTACSKKAMKLLEHHDTIYLKCPIAILSERLWDARTERPLISPLDNKKGLYSYVQKTLSKRKVYYNMARIVVWNVGDAKEVKQRILKKLKSIH